jgi:hypothetical protein
MTRRVVAVIVALLTLFAAGVAQAGEPRRLEPPRLEPQRNQLRIDNGGGRDHDRGDHLRRSRVIIVPQTTYIVERRCVTPGYWTYQWVPQVYAYNSWVAGQWAPDGSWIDGHYEPRYYQSGYYQPYWVDGYESAC